MGNLFGSVLQHVRILYSIQANCVLLRFFFVFFGGGGTPCFRIGVVEDNFFLFLRSLLWELWTPNLLFHSSNVGLKILKNWSMPLIYIKPNFQIWPKTKLSSLQWFEFLWQIPFVNIAIIPPFKARWGGWRGGSFDINTLFSYVAKEKIDPHNALGVFPQPIWGRSHIM